MAKFSTVRARKRFELGENAQEVLWPRPYREYVAVLTQAGTAAPTAAVLKNNLLDSGAAVVLTRPAGVGVYVLTLTGAFTAAKTLILLTVETAATGILATADHTSANAITITTATEAGVAADLVGKLNVMIRVYA